MSLFRTLALVTAGVATGAAIAYTATQVADAHYKNRNRRLRIAELEGKLAAARTARVEIDRVLPMGSGPFDALLADLDPEIAALQRELDLLRTA